MTCIARIETPIKERGYATILKPISSSSIGLSIGVLPPPSSILAYTRAQPNKSFEAPMHSFISSINRIVPFWEQAEKLRRKPSSLLWKQARL